MAMAMTLIRMSVVGIPLLLALFQFVNDHVYDERDEDLTLRTLSLGGTMILSSCLLLGMYYAGLCTINSTLPSSSLTSLISLFIVPLFVIILITIHAQFTQMVPPGLRLTTWMWSIGVAWGYVAFIGVIAEGYTQEVVAAYGLLFVFGLLGWMDYPTLDDSDNVDDDSDDEPAWWGIE